MAKTQDIPKDLRDFNKLFEDFTRRHDWGRSYCDFIQWTATSFAFRAAGINDEWLDKRHKDAVHRYDERERALLQPMLHAMTTALAGEITMNGWGDQLGEFYEVIASSHKSSYLGQFFTPHSLCDLIVGMQPDLERRIVNDPACGSGRLLLALHGKDPKTRAYNVACDIDPICCDMTAINMLMHGMEGEVIEMDTLRMEFRRGWRINPWMYSLDMVCIVPILKQSDSYMFGGNPLAFGHWHEHAEAIKARPREPTVIAKPVPKLTSTHKPNTSSQLTLF